MELLTFIVEDAQLDVVMPGWVPITDEDKASRTSTSVVRDPRWDSLPRPPAELIERKPWRPYDA